MNYLSYKKYMQENNLIESPESIQNIVNAIRVNDNIKTIKSIRQEDLSVYDTFGLNPEELEKQFLEDKDFYISRAIKKAYPLEWAMEKFKPIGIYKLQIEELQKNLEPTVASIEGIEIRKQMGDD